MTSVSSAAWSGTWGCARLLQPTVLPGKGRKDGAKHLYLPQQDQTLCTSPLFQFQQVPGGTSWQPGAENGVASISVTTRSVKEGSGLKGAHKYPISLNFLPLMVAGGGRVAVPEGHAGWQHGHVGAVGAWTPPPCSITMAWKSRNPPDRSQTLSKRHIFSFRKWGCDKNKDVPLQG